jgi:hypothetical protein
MASQLEATDEVLDNSWISRPPTIVVSHLSCLASKYVLVGSVEPAEPSYFGHSMMGRGSKNYGF